MPGTFTFSNTFTSANFLSQTMLTKGAGPGIDDDTLFSAQGGAFTFTKNAVNIVSVALQSGQTLKLDVDFGVGNNINPIDTELWVADANGKLLASNDFSSADLGSINGNDPRLDFTAAAQGLYFVIVTQRNNDYLDGKFAFDNGGNDTGVFQLNAAIAGLSALTLGTAGNDSVSLAGTERRYDAGDGNDFVYAAAVKSIIDGGGGDDSLYGNTKQDVLFGGDGSDYMSGSLGNDVLVGGAEYDNLLGAEDNDQLFGGDDGDYLDGYTGKDILWGERGADSLIGGEGDDISYGGGGADYHYHGPGNDIERGGAGKDIYYAYSADAKITVNIAQAAAQDTGAGLDILDGIESVVGTNGFGDTIKGNDSENRLEGYGGDDFLFGYGGIDSLDGGLGDDRLRGGGDIDGLAGQDGKDQIFGDDGSDSITGGAGADSLSGGSGQDTFYYNVAADSLPDAQDIITDFSQAEGDRIYMFSLFSGVLEFRGSGPFQNTGGEVRSEDKGAFQKVYVNLDTDASAEMVIRVNTPNPLALGDFVL